MDEGSFVIGDMPTFGLNMDLETELTSHDDILFYLTTGDQDATFDPHMTLGELASPPLVPTFSDPASFSSSPISSSPASSPPFSFTSSPSDSGASPVSSPSSYTSSGQSSPASLDSDHFVFGSWIEAAVDPTSTIAPTQLQESVVVDHHIMPPLAILSPTDETVTSLAAPSPKEESQEETKPSKKDTRKRKRTRKSSDEPPPQTAVTLPRDELLKLSSQELEDYAENLRKVRKLTPEEEKDLRRQRRLIKNRESAQLSRVRRREHVEELQQQLQEMQNENVRLQRQVESLTAENLQLKQHIAASSSSSSPSSSYSSTPQASPVPSAELSASAMEAGRMSADPPASPSLSKLLHSWTSLGKDATATAVKATYLFVILLSIGIFFNARFMHYGPGLGPMEVGPYRGLPHFYDAARPVIESGAASSQPVYIESLNDKPVGSSSHSVSTNSHRGARDWRRRDILQADDELPLSTRSLDDKMDVVQSSTVEDASQGLSNPWKKETMFPLGVDRQATTMTTGEAANKTVLMCPSFHALQWPGPEASSATDEITFILPASSAAYLPALHQPSSSFVASARRTNGGSMVQLTCKVLDARMASLDSLLVS